MKRTYFIIAGVLLTLFFVNVFAVYSQELKTGQKSVPPPKTEGFRLGVPLDSQERDVQVPAPPSLAILYLTEEQEDEVMEFLYKTDKRRAEMLGKIKDSDPKDYRRQLSLAFREMRELKRLQEDDPERYERVIKEKELNYHSYVLMGEYKKAKDEEKKTKIRNDLIKLLDELFDLRQLNREEEIERLEKRIAELKEINNKRLENKENIVLNRLATLLKEDRGLEW